MDELHIMSYNSTGLSEGKIVFIRELFTSQMFYYYKKYGALNQHFPNLVMYMMIISGMDCVV